MFLIQDKIDVYEKLITGVGTAEMSHLQNCSVKIFKEHRRDFTHKKMKKCLKNEGGGGVRSGGGGRFGG